MSTIDISLVKDLANSVLVQRAQPPPTVIPLYFQRSSLLIKDIDRTYISDDFKIGEQRDRPEVATKGEEALPTATLSLTSTSESAGATTVPLRPTITSILRCHESFYSIW